MTIEGWKPADPPAGPEAVSPVTVPLGMVAVVGLVAVDTVTGGLLSFLDAIPGGGGGGGDDDGPPLLPPPPDGTAAPSRRGAATVVCTRCARAVPYHSMALNEHGYFCPRCGPSQPA